ncbi:16S rRNA (guanine(527)-N(7))-methyltransferase RsmG [bacterium]|nr:16S rRNA (guanine(527)-N(7))-methyltransferase RsmG [bacterium]
MFHVKQIEIIEKALAALNIQASAQTLKLFSEYNDLIRKANLRLNLVSEKDVNRIAEQHFIDSLGFARYADFSSDTMIMDLGSGAGFPGIVLAVLFPETPVVLVESRKKKAQFLENTVKSLALKSVEVIGERAENLKGSDYIFSTVLARSVAKTSVLVKWCSSVLNPSHGRIITIKGPDVKQELSELAKIAAKYSIKKWDKVPFDPFPEIIRRPKRTLVTVYTGIT